MALMALLFLGLQNDIFSPFPLHRRGITYSLVSFVLNKVTVEDHNYI
jgi:hypothetical protein